MLCQSGRAAKRQDRKLISAQSKQAVAAAGAPKRRKQQADNEIDPHDEMPTFVKVVSDRHGSPTSCDNEGRLPE